jgi:hypothetical protein
MELDFASPAAPGPNTDPKTSSIVARGTHKKVAGFDCEEWTAEDGAGHKADVCLAEGVTFLDLNRLRSGGAESALGKRFRQNKSFPLESVEYDASGKELSRMKVIQIDRAAEPDSAFVIPAGYVKTEMPQRPPQR